MGRASLLFHTIKYLKPTQVGYQIWYRMKNRSWRSANYDALLHTRLHRLPAAPVNLFPAVGKYRSNHSFTFLNLSHQFDAGIDWNWNGYGKLWNYNLQYFDYLHDTEIAVEDRQMLIEDFCKAYLAKQLPPEPYPVSLRLMNWALFHTVTGYQSPQFLLAFQQQTDYLRNNLEFHIQANHLLENYFALVIAGLTLDEEPVVQQGLDGVLAELHEQTLADGAHYECSPMYHQIILSRLLFVIAALQKRTDLAKAINEMKQVASRMMGWMQAFNFRDGSFAYVNDATTGIAADMQVLLTEATALGMQTSTQTLGISGYRRWNQGDFEWMIDVGNILPTYQPGHAHSDMLQVLLRFKGKPVLVETGISTYQTDARRQLERRTSAHNTVTVEEADQSDVWGSFRVGRRAKLMIGSEQKDSITAMHDGYTGRFGVTHQRRFDLQSDGGLRLTDQLLGKQQVQGVARFHFDHTIQVVAQSQTRIACSNGLVLDIQGADHCEIGTYQQALGYNSLMPATVLAIQFKQELITTIYQP
jgi:uncharacterized heparinase superfamily protein